MRVCYYVFPDWPHFSQFFYFLMAHIAQVFSSQALCIDNVKKYWLCTPDWRSTISHIERHSHLHFYFFFKNSFIWNGSIFSCFPCLCLYMFVCRHVSFSVLLKRIKQTASINLNLMCISFSDVFLACTAVCQVITLSKQAINHPLFSPEVE